MASAPQFFTAEEVAKHDGGLRLRRLQREEAALRATNSESAEALHRLRKEQAECVRSVWIILHEQVYDVSAFLPEHPGGPEIILEMAGKDATEYFEKYRHSSIARRLAERLVIGYLATDAPHTASPSQPSSSASDAAPIPVSGALLSPSTLTAPEVIAATGSAPEDLAAAAAASSLLGSSNSSGIVPLLGDTTEGKDGEASALCLSPSDVGMR